MQLRKYRIVAYKRNSGDMVQGTCMHDGLSSLYFVTDDEKPDSQPTTVSVLDRIVTFEEIHD